jgi:XTP/dITP diphosphohydrolase
MKIVFATHNANKLKEVRAHLADRYEVLGLNDVDCHEEIPETGQTLEENALIKARYVFDNYGLDCFADDTGLMVDVLNGAPGVYSARYAGEHGDSEANMTKLLRELEGISDRTARFVTVIALVRKGHRDEVFYGKVEGQITTERSGKDGFGYDPIFRPEGYDITFAEMALTEKNQISHRGKAVAQLVDFLANA